MKQKPTIIQPYIHLALKNADEKLLSSPCCMHIYDIGKENHDSAAFPKTLDIVPSVSCIWIIAYDTPSKSRFICIGSQSKKITVDIGNYKYGFVAIFDDNAVYFNKGTAATLSPANLADKVMDFEPDSTCPEYAFIERILNTDNISDKCKAFKDYLNSSKRRYEFSEDLSKMRSIITESNGDCHVTELADATGYSCRHINRQFCTIYGFGPKEMCMRLRFQHALCEIFSEPNRQNSEFIQNIGYSDQAHFQREFKSFMGETPKQFAKKLKSGSVK